MCPRRSLAHDARSPTAIQTVSALIWSGDAPVVPIGKMGVQFDRKRCAPIAASRSPARATLPTATRTSRSDMNCHAAGGPAPPSSSRKAPPLSTTGGVERSPSTSPISTNPAVRRSLRCPFSAAFLARNVAPPQAAQHEPRPAARPAPASGRPAARRPRSMPAAPGDPAPSHPHEESFGREFIQRRRSHAPHDENDNRWRDARSQPPALFQAPPAPASTDASATAGLRPSCGSCVMRRPPRRKND
jgi:hypothetical protein